MQRCPYCGMNGTRKEIDDHIIFMTTIAKDQAHQTLTGFASAAPTTWRIR